MRPPTIVLVFSAARKPLTVISIFTTSEAAGNSPRSADIKADSSPSRRPSPVFAPTRNQPAYRRCASASSLPSGSVALTERGAGSVARRDRASSGYTDLPDSSSRRWICSGSVDSRRRDDQRGHGDSSKPDAAMRRRISRPTWSRSRTRARSATCSPGHHCKIAQLVAIMPPERGPARRRVVTELANPASRPARRGQGTRQRSRSIEFVYEFQASTVFGAACGGASSVRRGRWA